MCLLKPEDDETELKDFREIVASSHINFLFGAGVNGKAFPQLRNFTNTIKYMEELGQTGDTLFEEKLNGLSEELRIKAAKKFCEEFNEIKVDYEDQSILNLKGLLEITCKLVNLTENRQSSMKKINIFTLNYDDIVENIIDDLGYFKTVATVDNLRTMPLFDVVPYNLEYKKEMPAFVVAKIHGTIRKGILAPRQIIYPGNQKYESSMASDFFEVIFKMKSELMKMNAVLFVIGYSGADNHINNVIKDCIDNGLTVYWFKYDNKKEVPELFKNKIIEINQEKNPVDTTYICYKKIKEVISNGNR